MPYYQRRHAPLSCERSLRIVLCVLLLSVSHIHSSAARGVHHGQSHENHLHDAHPMERPLLDLQAVREFSSNVLDNKEELWALSGNMANFLQLPKVSSVSLPVHVNLVFLGFDGDGKHEFTLQDEDFGPWFRHIEHTLEHTTVPIGEEQVTVRRRDTAHSSLLHRMHITVAKFSPLVNTVIEDILLWALRPEDASFFKGNHAEVEGQTFYVDPNRISVVLNTLLHHLNMTDAFTVFVMNPKPPVSEHETYGYRTGYSNSEIELLSQSREFHVDRPRREHTTRSLQDVLDVMHRQVQPVDLQAGQRQKPLVSTLDLVQETERWARGYIAHYGKPATDQQKPKSPTSGESVGSESVSSSEDAAQNLFASLLPPDAPELLLRRREEPLRSVVDLAKEIALSGSYDERLYLYNIQNNVVMHENCLVDAWIGRDRFAFIDLSAGPFRWGPSIYGEGVRSKLTLPRVPLVDRNERHDHGEGEHLAPLISELDYLTMQMKEYCAVDESESNKARTFFCESLTTRRDAIKKRLRESESKLSKEDNAAFDRYFDRDMGRGVPDLVGSPDEGADQNPVVDQFLGHLGSVLSSFLRHVVAAPTPLYPIKFFPRVSFQVHLITDHHDYDPLDSRGFDFDIFKQELVKFKMPSQEFVFTLKRMEMQEDPAVAMALETAAEMVQVPLLSPREGDLSVHSQRYLDSRVLRAALSTGALASSNPMSGVQSMDGVSFEEIDVDDEDMAVTKVIPIFIFSYGTTNPTLLDKYYQSKALVDMVFAVQSKAAQFRSRVVCNGEPVVWNLRDPTRSVIAATALLLGGVIPKHISYSHERRAALQEWVWSVGECPTSHTSPLAHTVGQMEVDIAHRNYVLESLQGTVLLLNAALDELADVETTEETWKHFKVYPVDELCKLHARVSAGLSEVISHVEALEFARAIKIVNRAYKHATLFHRLAFRTSAQMAQVQCAELAEHEQVQQPRAVRTWILPAFLLMDALLVAFFMLFRRRGASKVKLN